MRACRASLLALMTAAEAKKNQQRQQLDKVFSFVETETEIVAITNTSTFCTPSPPSSSHSLAVSFLCLLALLLLLSPAAVVGINVIDIVIAIDCHRVEGEGKRDVASCSALSAPT